MASPETLEEVAQARGLDRLQVLRAVATAKADATERADGGPAYMTERQQQKWEIAGMPGIDVPPNAGGWFRQPYIAYLADEGYNRMVRASGEQVPDTPPAADVVRIKITQSVRAAMRTRPADLIRVPGRGDPGVDDVRTAYLVQQVRAVARQVLREAGPEAQVKPLETLYRSPSNYRRIVGEAVVRVKADAIVLTRDYPGERGQPRTIRFELSHADLMGGDTMAQVLAVAF